MPQGRDQKPQYELLQRTIEEYSSRIVEMESESRKLALLSS